MLRPLFAGKAPPSERGTPLVQAARLTKRFLSHYSHAVPFDRRALEAAWARCREPRCAEARREAESRIGALHDDAWGQGGRLESRTPRSEAEPSAGQALPLAPRGRAPDTRSEATPGSGEGE